MPSPLSNPYNLGQNNDLVKNALIAWQKGAEMARQDSLGVRTLFWEKPAEQLNEELAEGYSSSGFSTVTGDGEDFALVTKTQGDTLNLTQLKRTARAKITQDLMEFSKYPQIAAELQEVGGYLWRGYALDLTHRFTFAFDTSYTDRGGATISTVGGDAAALCANTHTLNSGDTFDNLLTARLSESSLEDAEDLMNAFIDHNGELVNPRADTLITGTHSETRHVGERLTTQPMQLDSDFNNVSVYKGAFKHVVLPYLDTTAAGAKNTAKYRYWFIMDSRLGSAPNGHLVASVRRFPTMDPMTTDPDNNNKQFKAYMYYDIGHNAANWIVGSNAS